MAAISSLARVLAAFNSNGWSLVRGVRAALGCCVPLLAALGRLLNEMLRQLSVVSDAARGLVGRK